MKTKIYFTILLVVMLGGATAQVSDDVRVYRDISIAYIIKGHGDSAVYITGVLLVKYPRDPFHHYLASNAYRTLYMNIQQGCSSRQTGCDQLEGLKRMTIRHMSDADSLLRRLYPDSTFYLNAKASKYEEFKDQEKAYEVYNQSLEVRQNQKDVLRHLITNAIDQGDTTRAFHYFDRLMRLPDATREHTLHYVDMLLQHGYYQKALKVLDEDDSHRTDLTFLYQRIRAQMGLESFGEATRGCGELILKLTQDTAYVWEFSPGELYFICGEAYYQEGDFNHAVELYNRSLPYDTSGFFAVRLSQIFEENPAFYFEQYLTERSVMSKIGFVRERVTDFERNVGHIQRILATYGDSLPSPMLDSLGNLYTGIGDYINARRVYIALIRIEPDVSYQVKLALVLYRLGDLNESEFYMDKVIGVMPQNKDMNILRVLLAVDRVKRGLTTCQTIQQAVDGADLSNLSAEERIWLCELVIDQCSNVICNQ